MKVRLVTIVALFTTACTSFAAQRNVRRVFTAVSYDVPSVVALKGQFGQIARACMSKSPYHGGQYCATFGSQVGKTRRLEEFYLRLFTASCQGEPSDERFKLDVSLEERQLEEARSEAMRKIRESNPRVANCVRAKMRELARRAHASEDPGQEWEREQRPFRGAAEKEVYKVWRRAQQE